MTSKIRFRGATSGFVELAAPDAAGSNTLTLPTGNGTTGQYLQTDGAGELSWQTVPNNGFESYAVICDSKTATTAGGTFTAGSHIQRDLNTELFDPDGIVSISSNQFTVAAGNYLIVWRAPAFRVGRNTSRLRDVTGDTTAGEGTSNWTNNSGGDVTASWGWARVTPTASNTYEIRHRCETTFNTEGLGVSSSDTSTESIYTTVWIFKEA